MSTTEWVKINGKWIEKSTTEENDSCHESNNLLLHLLAKSSGINTSTVAEPKSPVAPVTSIPNRIDDVENDNVSVFSERSFASSSEYSHPGSNKSWYVEMDNRVLTSSNAFPVEQTENNDVTILNRLATIERNEMKMYSSHKKLLLDLEESRRSNDLLQEKVVQLEKDLSRLDQYGRRENIEIAGIPNTVSDKALEKEIIKILHKIGMDWIDSYCIVGCHRIGGKDKFGSRNVIIRFLHRKDAQTALHRKKELVACKEIGYNHLYMSENLCPAFRSVLKDMNDLKRTGKVGAVWVTNGTIKYKIQDLDSVKPEKIYHKSDVSNLKSYLGVEP